jgi:hypothetical protein
MRSAADYFATWQSQHENKKEPEQISIRLRCSNAEKIAEIQQNYGLNRSQLINDLIAIGLMQLK